MTPVRRCKVTLTTPEDVTHIVEVSGTSVFEVAVAGITQLRQKGWIAPLAADGVVCLEMRFAPMIHEVPVKALESWAKGPSVSPMEGIAKRRHVLFPRALATCYNLWAPDESDDLVLHARRRAPHLRDAPRR